MYMLSLHIVIIMYSVVVDHDTNDDTNTNTSTNTSLN